jgi:glutamine cyclotransferase
VFYIAYIVLKCGLGLGAVCLAQSPAIAPPSKAKTYRCEIVNSFPHDSTAFTQGLTFIDGELYEGTGLNGHSSIRRVELGTGKVLQRCDLPQKYFGEGITIWEDKLVQLTWKSKTGFIYDRRTFVMRSSFSYPTSGWGLTHDDKRFIMSDGSDTIYFRDPETFAETGRVRVSDGSVAVTELNELEFVHGEIWANIWGKYRIARISPDSGQVLSWIDISNLMPALDRLLVGSPNGIAYDVAGDRIFVTGKRWPRLFEIRLPP